MKMTLFVWVFLLLQGLGLGKLWGQAKDKNNPVKAWQEEGRFKEAERWIKNQQALYAKSDSLYWDLAYDLADNYFWEGDYELSAEVFLQALEPSAKYEELYLRQLNGLARTYSKLGYFEEAERRYKELLERQIKHTGEDTPEHAMVLHNMMVLYTRMQRHEVAEAHGKRALAIREAIFGREHILYGVSLNNLGAVYFRMKDYGRAEIYFMRSLDVFAKIDGGKNMNYVNNLGELALLRTKLKRYPEAERLYFQALELESTKYGKRHENYLKTLNNLAVFYLRHMNAVDKARATLLKALALHEERGQTTETYLASLGNMAELEEAGGASYAEVLVWIERALEVNARGYSLKGQLPSETWAKAFRGLDFAWHKSLLRSLDLWYRLLLKAHEREGSKAYLEQAYWLCRAAVDVLQDFRVDKGLGQDRFRLMEEADEWTRRAFDLDLDLQGDKPKDLQRFFDLMERNRSAMLFESLQGSRARQNGYLPDSLASLQTELQAEEQRLRQALFTGSLEQRGDLERNLLDLTNRQDLLRKRIAKDYPKYHELKYHRLAARLVDIQASLPTKTVLLEYFVVLERSYLLMIHRERVALLTLPLARLALQQRVDSLYALLSQFDPNASQGADKAGFIDLAHGLYGDLLAKFFEENQDLKAVNHLWIVADGPLHRLPFDVLLSSKPKGDLSYGRLPYLIRDYAISYHYAGSLVLSTDKAVKQIGSILALAGSYEEAGQPKKKTNHSEMASVLRKDLSPLPLALAEVEELKRRFRGRFFLAKEATEHHFKLWASNYDLIHLAVHGFVDEEAPNRSALILTEGSDLEDDLLYVYEIAALNLKAKLVVLSACETGRGKRQDGEGILSLGHAFMYAGVPSLLVSLWRVNDYSTKFIMLSFYEHLAAGQDQAQALRLAKLAYLDAQMELDRELLCHPSFWSAFINLGDNAVFDLPNRWSWKQWSFLLIGIFLVLGLIFLLRSGTFKRI